MTDLPDLEIPPDVLNAMARGESITFIGMDTGDALPPPSPEFILSTLRTGLEAAGEVLNLVIVGTATETMMCPTPLHPLKVFAVLAAMRAGGKVGPLSWIAVGIDTYVRSDYPPDGLTPTEAFEKGLPDAGEALTVMCVAPDGPGYYYEHHYTRTPGGFVFDDEVIDHTSHERIDPMYDAMLATVAL